MTLKKSGHPPLAGGPIYLKMGWPHDPPGGGDVKGVPVRLRPWPDIGRSDISHAEALQVTRLLDALGIESERPG